MTNEKTVNRNLGYASIEHLKDEVYSMNCYATSNNIEIKPKLIQSVVVLCGQKNEDMSQRNIGDLASVHQQLARMLAPATPQAISLMHAEKERGGLLSFFSVVPISRHIITIAIFLLIMLVAIGQYEKVNTTNILNGILGNHGEIAVYIMLYLICYAGLGACFAALYKVNHYISSAIYDPRYDSTYWSSIILGVIAGVFMCEILADVLFPAAAADASVSSSGEANVSNGDEASANTTVSDGNAATKSDADTANDSSSEQDQHFIGGVKMGKPLLAVLGGFSANMVYRVLQRLVDSVESLVKGDPRVVNDAKIEAEKLRAQGSEKEMQLSIANQMIELDSLYAENPEKGKLKMKELLDDLLDREKSGKENSVQ